MPSFLCPQLADLTRQLIYTPAARARKQMDNAESLYWELDPDRTYPFEFIAYRITRFRPETDSNVMLPGAAVRRDLLLFVESISSAVGDDQDAYEGRALNLAQVCRTLRVTEKSVSRYRRQGLFARRIRWPDGRKRIGFLSDSLARFVASREEQIKRAADFSRIDGPTEQRILTRARRIRSRVRATPFAVARHLAARHHRTVEAVRLLLLRHDRNDPRHALFPEHTPALSERDQRIILRAYRRGVRVSKLCTRFQRSRGAIYRAIHLQHLAALRALPLRCVANPTFELPDARDILFSTDARISPDDAHVDARTESSLFVRYNFLKHHAIQRLATLDPLHPRPSTLDEIETTLRHAASIRDQLARGFLRQVRSIANRHTTGTRETATRSIADLMGEGSLVLLETIETFDPGRGNRYSTYLTWALMKRFARVGTKPTPLTLAEMPSVARQLAEPDDRSVEPLLAHLTERERFVVTRRFGIAPENSESADPQTLAQIAAQLGLSSERVRRIELGAMVKLRTLASKMDLSMENLDALDSPWDQ